MAEQDETIAFLSEPASYGPGNSMVERIETHCSIIFLVGNRAYKLKRAIAFSSLDYATLERREAACKAEVSLNRRTALDLYLEARAIRRTGDGRRTFDGNGPAVDWVVVMRRFDQADLLDHLADAHRLDATMMHRLADDLAAFHAGAEVTSGFGGSAAIRAALERWRQEWGGVSAAGDTAAGQAYYDEAMAALVDVAALLDLRREQGKVRRCHGDLRLANICLLEGRPTPFDCIEFSDETACIDVLYDLAFPLMELSHRGLGECCNALFNHYVDVTGESEGLRAVPLFMSLRAAMRAQMLAAAVLRHAPAEAPHLLALARSHLALARALLRRRQARLIAIGGLSGSGKWAVAQALAAESAPAPGARVIRSDTVRKRLLNVGLETRLPPTAYDAATTRQVYDTLCGDAATALAAGASVVVDATFLRTEDRRSMAELARVAGVPFTGLWLHMSVEALAPRAGYIRSTVAPRDRAVLQQQLATDHGPLDWHMIDTGRGPTLSLAAARLLTEAFHS